VTYFVVSSTYQLEDVEVVGSTRYTAAEIKDYLVTGKADQITFMMYLGEKLSDPVSIPFVESYAVSMKDRHTIQVTVYEKILIGCVKLLDSYMYFDRDGIVVESSKERIEGVPLITGLKFDKILLHEKLEIQKNNLYDMILNLTKTIQKFELNVDKVLINSDYEVTLYCNENEVLLGKKDFYDVQLEALASVLSSSKDMKLSYDMRFYNENNKKITAQPMD
jgi:cell division protein FtsQ